MDKQAIGYVRVSKVGEREELLSPELQRHEQERWAQAHGTKIIDWVEDLDETGRRFEKRKIKEIIERIQAGEATTVLLWKWSRWGRNLLQSRIYIAAVEAAGGEVRAATEDFDPNTTMGKFTRDQMLMIAELQSNQISDGWKETHALRRRRGLPHTAGPRFGYTYTKKDGYKPDPKTAPILREAYKRLVAGTSLRSIALEWNAQGLRTTQGKLWNPTSFGRVFDTGFAAGLIRERSNPPTSATNKRSIKEFDIWRTGAHEPIISAETWEAYRAKREANAGLPPRLRVAAHALSGLVYCALCETRMVSAYSGRNKRHSWRCYKASDTKTHTAVTVSNLRLESHIKAWVLEHAQGGQTFEEDARHLAHRATADVATLETEIRRLTTKRRRLLDVYTDGGAERADYLVQKTEVDEALEVAEKQLRAAKAAARSMPPIAVFKTLAEEWDDTPASDKREALSKVIAQIRVTDQAWGHPGKVEIVPRWLAGLP